MFDWHCATGRAMRIGWMSAETWSASLVVMAERGAMLLSAAINPASLDMREVGRMFPEKVDAFTRGMAGAARARDPIEAAERVLAPVHARVTANARRLRRR